MSDSPGDNSMWKRRFLFRRGVAVAIAFPLMLAPAPVRAARWWLDVERGRADARFNDVQIPGDSGTRFSLTDDLHSDPTIYGRVRLGVEVSERNRLILLLAPLEIEAAGALARPVSFEGTTFAAGTPLSALYRFNSWRLTWRYDFVAGPRWWVGGGVTASVRDAEIALKGGGQRSLKSNVGFVPLLHGHLSGPISGRLGLLVEADALAAPQGRAEDLFAGLTWTVSNAVVARLGYRLLEGGTDNDAVYNFAWIDYWGGGVALHFGGDP